MLALLTEFAGSLNIDKNMNATQLNVCAEDLTESNEFYMLRMEDFKLCFKWARQGKYGEFYNRLDQPMIFGFLRKYMGERDSAIARKRDAEQGNYMQEVFQSDVMKGILKDVTDKLTIKEEPKEKVKHPDLNPLVQEALLIFDAYAAEVGALRCVECLLPDGEVKMLGQHDFVNTLLSYDSWSEFNGQVKFYNK